ncbi:MAG TPA: hypothetical protein VIY73_02510 [Polyangiaceae bacterium]
MFSRKADGPLSVQIPSPAEDRPSWSRVGVIAAIGFLVGVAWPKLAGVRMGPSLPESASTVASGASGAPAAEAPTGPGPSPSPTVPAFAATPVGGTSAPAAPPSAAAVPVSVTVGHGVVFACKSSDGDSMKGGDCGSLPGLDGIVMPRLRQLAACPDAATASGKLHLVVHADFPRGGLRVDLGRGHAVSAPDALLACAKEDMKDAALTGVQHENPRYSVAYSVTFAGGAPPPAAAVEGASPSASHAAPSGDGSSAQIVWEVAIIRDAPKTGKVVARLQRGTEIHLGAPKDGWYPVKFGDGFASDGFVYRGAIGK